ncbi:hypothetical protein Tco_0864412 [Tanacetum coccineum]
MADARPMAEQLQAPTGGFESAIVVPVINAQNFELKSSLINLVQNRIFRGGNDEEPHAHIRHLRAFTKQPKFFKFHHFFFPPLKPPIFGNEITNFRQIAQESSPKLGAFQGTSKEVPHHVSTNAPPLRIPSSTLSSNKVAAQLEDKMTLTFRNEINEMKNMMKALVPTPAPIKAVEESCITCVQATLQNQINSLKGEFKNELKAQHNLFVNQQNDFQNNLQNMLSGFFQNQSQPSTSTSMVPTTLPSNTITNPRSEVRAITTRSGLSYTPVPPIPPPLYDENEPLTEKETEVTKDKVLPSTKDIQPPVIQKSQDPVKPVSSPISPEPSSAQVDNSPLSKEPSKETKLPYPSRVEHEKKGDVLFSTINEDKIFKPGIFDKDAFNDDKSSKELAPSKALLTLDFGEVSFLEFFTIANILDIMTLVWERVKRKGDSNNKQALRGRHPC